MNVTTRIKFWLLDLNEGVSDGQRCIFLWGIDANGRRVLLLDRDFRTSFLIPMKDRSQAGSILKQLSELAAKVDQGIELSVETKRLLGREVDAVRVKYADSSKAERLVSAAKKVKGLGAALELDVRPSLLYLLETEATPCSWHDVEVTEAEGSEGYMVSSVYYAKGGLRRSGDLSAPPLRVMAFYVVRRATRGTPEAKRDPVLVISTKSEKGVNSLITDGDDDANVLSSFSGLVRRHDPDILVGFRGNSILWPYLTARARIGDVSLTLSRAMTEPHQSAFGHFSVTGRLSLDLSDVAGDIQELESKTLEALSAYVGASPTRGFLSLDETSTPEAWADGAAREGIVRASEQRAQAAYDACIKSMDFVMQLSSLTKLPADHVLTAAVGFRVESYLMSVAKTRGELIPPRQERPYYPYAGGLVLSPAPGMHEQVAVIDFRSMYPNIMISFNISPETLVRGRARPDKDVNASPDGRHQFVKEPQGFLPFALQGLIAERGKTEASASEAKSEPELRVLYARDRAVKVVSNAVYGYTGWPGARWYCMEVAESTTAWGRSLIRKATEMAASLGLGIIYGDTDSLFVSYDERKTSDLLRNIDKKLGFQARVEKVYSAVVFTEAKKRYAGLTVHGEIDIVGLEAVRSDWSEVARRAQRAVLSDLLTGKGSSAARSTLDGIVSSVRSGSVPLSEFVLWKTISRPLSEYTVRAPHVEAARALEAKGWSVRPGDRIGYVMVMTPGQAKSQVIPYQLAKNQSIDHEYYIREQILPACERILEAVEDKRQPAPHGTSGRK